MTSTTDPAHISRWQRDFLQRHRLDIQFLDTAQEWLVPLQHSLVEHQNSASRPVLIALNGCQGSGKTTVSDYLCTAMIQDHGLNTVSLSLDDFYLTRAERQALATSVHPLLATRGVPGTHDMGLLHQTLAQLLDANRNDEVCVPRFDKASDERRAIQDWSHINTPVDCVLLEGWCLGATSVSPDTLFPPMNTLERDEDAAGRWRAYSNESLQRDFQPLYALVDQWVMLCAPSFDCVFQWRREQEQKLAATLSPQATNRVMDDEALHRFIQHYERITRHCLAELPHKVNYLYRLNAQREVVDSIRHAQAEISS